MNELKRKDIFRKYETYISILKCLRFRKTECRYTN